MLTQEAPDMITKGNVVVNREACIMPNRVLNAEVSDHRLRRDRRNKKSYPELRQLHFIQSILQFIHTLIFNSHYHF